VPKNEDGEFELILGNKQLLGMFFVVVVLLGVFFVMGYLVGRNSAPLANVETSSVRGGDGKPLVVESPVPKSTPAPDTATTPSPEPSKPLETAVEKPTEPKPEPPKLEPTKPSTSKSEPAIKREIAKAEKRSTPVPSAAPAAGQLYLQLSATSKHDADGVVEVLRKNSFPAIDVEVPEKPGLFRVLVGPLAPAELNKTRTELQEKGFPGNVAIPKKF
jgi:hypothetical protein